MIITTCVSLLMSVKCASTLQRAFSEFLHYEIYLQCNHVFNLSQKYITIDTIIQIINVNKNVC